MVERTPLEVEALRAWFRAARGLEIPSTPSQSLMNAVVGNGGVAFEQSQRLIQYQPCLDLARLHHLTVADWLDLGPVESFPSEARGGQIGLGAPKATYGVAASPPRRQTSVLGRMPSLSVACVAL